MLSDALDAKVLLQDDCMSKHGKQYSRNVSHVRWAYCKPVATCVCVVGSLGQENRKTTCFWIVQEQQPTIDQLRSCTVAQLQSCDVWNIQFG